MHDRLRLAGGAARERDQAGVLGPSSTAGAGGPSNRHSSGTITTSTWVMPSSASPSSSAVALVGDDQLRARHLDAAGAGPSRAAARCTAARPRRCESRRTSSSPTRGGCRSASSPRPRGRSRARAASPPGERCGRTPRRTSTRAAMPSRASSTSATSPGGSRSRTSRAKFTPVFSSEHAQHDPGALTDGRSRRPVHREDRRAAGDHRDGAPVRRRADHAQRRALRPRGLVSRADRRADEGAGPVRGDDPRGVRRHGARPDDVRDDRRGALARAGSRSRASSTRTSSAPTC